MTKFSDHEKMVPNENKISESTKNSKPEHKVIYTISQRYKIQVQNHKSNQKSRVQNTTDGMKISSNFKFEYLSF